MQPGNPRSPARRLGSVLGLILVLLMAGCASVAPGTPTLAVSSARFCDPSRDQDAAAQAMQLQFAALVRNELESSGQRVALVSRSGVNLDSLGIRYTHSGVLLADVEDLRWAVRQLYYACDERRPYLYDQGLTGFLFGSDDPDHARVSIVWLPDAEAQRLRAAALDRALALRLLGAEYSANAYPFSTRYQNCNQWVAELLAVALAAEGATAASRVDAQRWLELSGYEASVVAVESPLLRVAARLSPLVHVDDHPPTDRRAARFRVSLPQGIEAFVRRRLPGAERIEFCRDGVRTILRRGWEPFGEDCRPQVGDRVFTLD